MHIVTSHRSPNFGPREIPVEFLVLHYTACDLARTLELFTSKEVGTTAHFVLAENGDLYDLGGAWDGKIFQGAHAGESYWQEATKKWEKLNLCSIGVEIVNLNGNIFPYTEAQYAALRELMLHLKERFPALRSPDRVVGHEQIAGFRGKADPGREFDWTRFFRQNYPGEPMPPREPMLSASEAAVLKGLATNADAAEQNSWKFWSDLSSQLEREVKAKGQRPS